jgi:hypothetical protein
LPAAKAFSQGWTGAARGGEWSQKSLQVIVKAHCGHAFGKPALANAAACPAHGAVEKRPRAAL